VPLKLREAEVCALATVARDSAAAATMARTTAQRTVALPYGLFNHRWRRVA
jgi:hypothetical protein